MKKIQKLLAIVLTVAMVLAMSVSAFATTVTTPSTADKDSITVNNLKEGDEVYLYKIIGAQYGDYGFEKYVWEDTSFAPKDMGENKVNGDDLANAVIFENGAVKGLTSDNITAYAQGLTYDKAIATETVKTGTSVTVSNLAPGSYVVLVKAAAEDAATVYNPMVGSIYYSVGGSDNTMTGDPVDASKPWALVTTNAYVKSSEPTIVKTTSEPKIDDGTPTTDPVRPANVADTGNDKGNDTAFGGTINFDVKTSIPSYSDEYKALKEEVTLEDGTKVQKNVLMYQVTDTMDKSLDLIADSIKVKVGTDEYTFDGKDVTPAGKVTIEVADGGHGYTVTLDGDYAIEMSQKDVKITYSAKLNDTASLNYDANENTVKLKYGHNPKDKTDTVEKYDKTYHYTFAIDGAIAGNEKWGGCTEWKEQPITHEFIKVGPNDIQELDPKVGTEKQYKSYKDDVYTDPQGLEGAEFTLYTDSSCAEGTELKRADGTVVKNTTDGFGYLLIEGLDAGNYWMKETKAPKDYTLNTHVIPVEITADYYDDGQLKSYTITIDGVGNRYDATYPTIDKGSTTEVLPDKITHTWIVNGQKYTYAKDAEAEAKKLAQSTYFFKNTKLSGLPSTGGVGTTIFTVTGVALMILAAAMLLVVRRAKEQA